MTQDPNPSQEQNDGLTTWASGYPPLLGWWATRITEQPLALQPQRRWWDGREWSLAVMPGETDAEVAAAAATPTRAAHIEWRGLRQQPPGGYEYPLVVSPRTYMAHKMHPPMKAPEVAGWVTRVKLVED